jgi:hypothetical protein
VLGSDSGKELSTISGKNPGELPGKKSGKELPDRVKLGSGGRAGQKWADKETSLYGKRPFCTQEQ